MDRRDFIKIAGLGAGAVGLGVGCVEKKEPVTRIAKPGEVITCWGIDQYGEKKMVQVTIDDARSMVINHGVNQGMIRI